MTPIRVQRKRAKGYKMPPNTVSVTRPGKWGNPYKIGTNYFGVLILSADAALQLFEIYLKAKIEIEPDFLKPLKGKNLACFCDLDHRCHADILLKIANE